MNLVNYLQFFEPIQDNISRVYATASGVILVLLGLWVVNFIVSLIQRTFATGKAIGSFYRKYLHRFFKTAFSQTFGLFNRNRANNTHPNKIFTDSVQQTSLIPFWGKRLN